MLKILISKVLPYNFFIEFPLTAFKIRLSFLLNTSPEYNQYASIFSRINIEKYASCFCKISVTCSHKISNIFHEVLLQQGFLLSRGTATAGGAIYNYFKNILSLFDVLPIFFFTTSEKTGDYYLQT